MWGAFDLFSLGREVWQADAGVQMGCYAKAAIEKNKSPLAIAKGLLKYSLAPTYFPTRYHAVSSAMEGLTTGFGMGPGVPPPPWAPRKFGEHHKGSNI